MSYWHALPEGWESLDYQEFLAVRREAIACVIRMDLGGYGNSKAVTHITKTYHR